MKISYFFTLIFSVCFVFGSALSGQMPMPPKGRRGAMLQPPPPTDMDMGDEGADYGEEDGFEDDMAADGPPMKAMPPQSQGVPSRRQGFQQKQGMKAPARLAPMAADDMDDVGGDGSPDYLESDGPPMPAPAQLPPRNYPPKMPELQSGQTGWNQMDLHSLVQGRSS